VGGGGGQRREALDDLAAAGADVLPFHVAANQKREPAEHLLLGQTGLAGDQFTYAIREILVVGHGGIVSLADPET